MSIAAIVEVLEQMISVHDTLLEQSERKKQALIHNDIAELSQITNKDAKFVKQLAELEQDRIRAVNEYMSSRGVALPVQLTASGLVRFVFKAEERARLAETQSKLQERVAKLKAANDLNNELIRQSLQFIEYSIDIIAGAPEQEAVYHNPKQQAYSTNRTNFFNFKA